MFEPTQYEIEQRVSQLAAEPGEEVADSLLSRADAVELVRETCGRLVFRGDPEYEKLRRIFYSNFRNVRPFAIGVCQTVHDVRCFVSLLWKYLLQGLRIPWTPRSGGHSTAGYSTIEGGLMLDLRGLQQCQVDLRNEVVHVGPGLQFQDLYRILHNYGRIVPAGICPQVRAGGYMQGGGYGFASRMFGINCDNVAEVEMVLADGTLTVANAQQNRDLFWAVRGGTGNNFGIVTRITYRMHRLHEVGGVKLRWWLRTSEEVKVGAQVLDLMQKKYMGTNDDRRLGYMAFLLFSQGELRLEMRALYRGEPGSWRELLSDFFNTPGVDVKVYPMGPYYKLNESVMADETAEELSPFHELLEEEMPPQEKQSRFFASPLGVEGWQKVIQHLQSWKGAESDKHKPLLNIEAGGAAIDDVLRGANAYVHRKDDFNAFLNVYWKTPEERPKALKFLEDWLKIIDPWTNQEAYQNYPKSYVTDWPQRYWAEYYPVLCEVKRKYDPKRLFDFEQAIGSDGRSPEGDLALVETLVPDIASALREPIEIIDPGESGD